MNEMNLRFKRRITPLFVYFLSFRTCSLFFPNHFSIYLKNIKVISNFKCLLGCYRNELIIYYIKDE